MHASTRLALFLLLSAPATAHASARTAPERADEILDAAFAHRLGEHMTELAIDAAHAGRAHNVELAASLLDGAVIEPGAVLSFNERVGARTLEAGFAEAPELHGGHLHDGIGGGVCQVATTLHVAAIEAGLEMVEHRVHSIPSHYAPLGLDATVFYGRIDFRVRNPHAFAVRVRARSAGGVLVVRLEGAAPVSQRTLETRIVRRLPAIEQTIVDPSLAPGARVIEERGRDGVVVRIRATDAEGARVDRMVRYSRAARVVRVGPPTAAAPAPHLKSTTRAALVEV